MRTSLPVGIVPITFGGFIPGMFKFLELSSKLYDVKKMATGRTTDEARPSEILMYCIRRRPILAEMTRFPHYRPSTPVGSLLAGLCLFWALPIGAEWRPVNAGLPPGARLVHMSFGDNRVIAAVAGAPGPGAFYELRDDAWRKIAPAVNKYAVRAPLIAGKRVFTVAHDHATLYELLNGAWRSRGAIAAGALKGCAKFHLAVVRAGRIFCPGGKHAGHLLVYDLTQNRWQAPIQSLLPRGPQGINGFALSRDGRAVFVSIRGNADLTDGRTAIWRGDLETGRWSPLPFGVAQSHPRYRELLKDYINATGNKPGPARLLGADDAGRVYASTQQGVFILGDTADERHAPTFADGDVDRRWLPRYSTWYRGGGFAHGKYLFTTYNKGALKRWDDAYSYLALPWSFPACTRTTPVFSPDGSTLYVGAVVYRPSPNPKGVRKCTRDVKEHRGILRLTVNESAPRTSLDLPLRSASYLGDTGDDATTGVILTPAGQMVLAINRGNFGSLALIGMNGLIQKELPMSGRVHDIARRGEHMVAAGDFGIVVFDAGLGVKRKLIPGTKTARVAVDSRGGIAAISGKTVITFAPNGEERARVDLKRSYVTDVETDGRRVFVTGFDNKRNRNPVQVAFLEARDVNALDREYLRWGYPASKVANDMADTRIYRVHLGANGKLYVLGESAGGNTIFRWDGVSLNQSKLIKYDVYNDPWSLKSAHILYYAELDPVSGKVLRGQFAIPRLTSKRNLGNSFRAKNGSIHVDRAGRIYITGASACCIPNGNLSRVGGQRPGKRYAGGAVLLVVTPDLRSRRLWTTFGSGGLTGVAMNENVVVLSGTTGKKPNHKNVITPNAPRKQRAGGSDGWFTIMERKHLTGRDR